ncbi:MAG: MATE family efflux transporter [Bacteroidota bacterium]
MALNQGSCFWNTLALIIFTGIMLAAHIIPELFTNDEQLIGMTGPALRKIFLATPFLTIQLIGSAYFQAIGKALPALILSLLKQGIFLIPLVLLLPQWGGLGLDGVWYAFPIADILTAAVNFFFLRTAMSNLSTGTESSDVDESLAEEPAG